MTSAIAPPAAFGLISGTAFASASPAALAKILDSLDLASLEQEHSRLERAIHQLEQSNREITEFIELEQQELQEAHQAGGISSDMSTLEPDPEFVLAIEENKVVIAKYEKTCADLKGAIQKKRNESAAAGNSAAAAEDEANQDGVHL